ncbi:MAG: hypothetical protein AAB372_02515 [Patescibacteria group bacterium]
MDPLIQHVPPAVLKPLAKYGQILFILLAALNVIFAVYALLTNQGAMKLLWIIVDCIGMLLATLYLMWLDRELAKESVPPASTTTI